MSGWTYELLSAVVEDEGLLREVTGIISCLCNGTVGPMTTQRVRRARGIAIPKGDSSTFVLESDVALW